MTAVFSTVVCALLFLPIVSWAQPKGVTEVVYGLSSFDGEGYSPVFVPIEARAIYLLEGKPSVIRARRTQVYFWPLSEQYLPDWESLNEELDGRLCIRKGENIIQNLEKLPYALVYPRGPFGPGELAIDKEAESRYADFQREQQEYEDVLEKHYQEFMQYVGRMQRHPAPEEKPPKEPAKPIGFVTPPAKAFLLNLPAGNYSLSLIGPDGKEIEGSRRNLEVFQARRKRLGYKIIPLAKWTEPLQSPTEQDAIYAEGQSSLFIQPYAVQEFNEALYARLKNPQDKKASEGRWIWVFGQPDFSNPLQVKAIGACTARVEAALYLVEQIEGSKLGYRILKQSRKVLQPYEHGFTAYEVEIPRTGQLELSLLCGENEVCPKSQRKVVVVGQRPFMLYGIACFPLILISGLIFYRRISARPLVNSHGSGRR